MDKKYQLYQGPLDGLTVTFDEALCEGDEFEIPVDFTTTVPAGESSIHAAVLTKKYSGTIAVYVMEGSPCEPRYLKTKKRKTKARIAATRGVGP